MPRFCLKPSLSPDKTTFDKLDLLELSAISLFILFSALSASPWPDDQDGVNFVLGIIRYDPLIHQPHFPGYPVYIALGKLFAFFSGAPERGAVILATLSGALSIYLTIYILKTRFDKLTSLLCGIFMALNPVFFEFTHKIFTEATALALLLFSIAILKNPEISSGRRWFASLLAMGLLLGVRLSWWPFPFVYILAALFYKKITPATAGFVLGVLIWLVPQTTQMGFQTYLQSGVSFTQGHFTRWGGAIGSMFEKEHRIVLFLNRAAETWGLLPDSPAWLSAPWFLMTVTGLIISVNKWKHRAASRNLKTCLQNSTPSANGLFGLYFAALSGYIAWVFFGQNPEKVRHLVPLIPAFIIVTAPAVEKFHKGAWIAVFCLAISLSVNYSQRADNTPPYKQFREWVNQYPFSDSNFFCGPSERYFDLYPVRNRVVSVKSIKELPRAVKSTWPDSKRRFVCDDIPGLTEDRGAFKTFLRRKGDPADRTLKIYELL